MKRSDLRELHYITPIQNVPSIMNHGILCHQKARQLNHASVAMQEVQDIRSRKRVPGGLPLHAYVNLYFCARNPMMRKRAHQHLSLCVLQVSVGVLDLPNVVISDGNAASDYTAFWLPPLGLERVDFDLVFAEWWTDSNQIQQWIRPGSNVQRSWCPTGLIPALSKVGTFHVMRTKNCWKMQASDCQLRSIPSYSSKFKENIHGQSVDRRFI
jgi:hypothetical protein